MACANFASFRNVLVALLVSYLREVQKFSTSSIQVEQNSYFGGKKRKKTCSVLDPVYNQECFDKVLVLPVRSFIQWTHLLQQCISTTGISKQRHLKVLIVLTAEINWTVLFLELSTTSDIMEDNAPFSADAPGAPRQWWFGGGTDLTPSYIIEEDIKHFHSVCQCLLHLLNINLDPVMLAMFLFWPKAACSRLLCLTFV